MITRRRGRAAGRADAECVEVEVVDAVETVEDLPSPPEDFPADGIGAAGLDELNDLFGIEDLKWTLEKDSSSPFLDVEFADLDAYDMRGNESELEASTASSPERMPPDSKRKSRQRQSSHGINKNAIAARLNRLKKKEYVSSLEKKVGTLATENGALKQENCQLSQRVEELEDETRRPAPPTMTMPSPGSASKWRRKRNLAACVCTWTRTTCRWSSALSVRRARAPRSECRRVKYFCSPHVDTEPGEDRPGRTRLSSELQDVHVLMC